MRLLNTTSLKIEEFFDSIPQYAILSHTWGKKEISYSEWLYAQNQSPPSWGWVQDPETIDELKSREGYDKIIGSCRQACEDNYAWIWIDTICIDKTSSAELSEAINSMYEWYSASGTCYAYLADVPTLSYEDCCAQDSPFGKSRWFTRGWTLQELLAPGQVKFYSKDWLFLSDKSSLVKQIHFITGIPGNIITAKKDLHTRSIAQRMTWASSRTTTRIEDIAYCLLGIFNVNMPLLYGEGRKAFLRLQEEIVKRSSDQSFLVWSVLDDDLKVDRSSSLLASSPASFHVGRLVDGSIATHPFAFNNMGLSIRVPIVMTRISGFVFAALPFWIVKLHPTSRKAVWIPLMRFVENVYVRMVFPANYIEVDELITVPSQRVADIIISLEERMDCFQLFCQLGLQLPKLQKTVSPSPRVGVLLAFPSAIYGWKVCSVFPDYRDTSPPDCHNPDDDFDSIIWLKSCDGTCGVDFCSIEYVHPSNNAITVRFVLASRLNSNGLREPYARCASTGPKRTDLDSFSETTLEKLQNWSHADRDEWARVSISGPWHDFPPFDDSALSKPWIFLAQVTFKDPLDKKEA